jgi:hypothetical protein
MSKGSSASKLIVVALMAGVSTAGVGCVVQKDDAERFREAVPQQDEVALRVPGNGGSGGTKTQSLGIRTNGAGEVARYYKFTRDITDAADFTTAVILGSIWAIVHTPPTTVDAKKATWGPSEPKGLEPAIWRFTVTEIANNEYDYALEGQPKSGGAWLAILRGHGYGKAHPEHKQGWFEADNEAYRTLEPTRGKDYGKTKVTYDLRKIPATIKVDARPGDAKGFIDIVVTHEAQGAGSVKIDGLGDIDDSKSTKLEDVHLVSRWSSIGAGRADITMMNGDLPFTVTASECWSSSFARTFYKDTVNFEPASGDATSCAFAE